MNYLLGGDHLNHMYVPIKKDVSFFNNTAQLFSVNSEIGYHRHDVCEIFVLLNGQASFYVEHSCYELNKGDMIILSNDELHRSINRNNSEYESIGLNLSEEWIKLLSSRKTDLTKCFTDRESGEDNLLHLSVSELSFFKTNFSLIFSLQREQLLGNDLLINSYLIQILVKINLLFLQKNKSENFMPSLVQETMKYIRFNISKPIQLNNLEKHLNYSGTYISTCFKRHTGVTLRNYIIDQRIMLAKEYLQQDYTVEESCELSGFNNYSNFIRTFTKIVGISPGKFRRSFI